MAVLLEVAFMSRGSVVGIVVGSVAGKKKVLSVHFVFNFKTLPFLALLL